MLKYTDTQVTFAEVPDEIALCINLSNCPCHCNGCHSPYLAEDIGQVLTISRIENLLKANNGVTAICFMGGDNDPKLINHYAKVIKNSYVEKVKALHKLSNTTILAKGVTLNLGEGFPVIAHVPSTVKVAWYSGRQKLPDEIDINNFDYIKLGPYLKEYGPLNCRTTNQRFYEIIHDNMGSKMCDVTYKFWKYEAKN